jgi:hypothetical protein
MENRNEKRKEKETWRAGVEYGRKGDMESRSGVRKEKIH